MNEKTSALRGLLKPTRKKVIALIAALAVCATLAGFIRAGSGAPGGGMQGAGEAVRTVALARGSLASTVNATGMVYSTQSTEVYSTLSYQVNTVHVEVGDTVKEGDILAELDADSLELDIQQRQASVWSSQSAAQQNLASARQDLEAYKKNLEQDYDTSLLNARVAIETAELDVLSAELDVESAKTEARTARRNLQDAREGEGDYAEMGEATDAELDKLKDTLMARETALEKAQNNLEKAKTNLEKAKATLAATEEGASDSIVTYENKVKSAQINSNFNDQYIAIEKLQGDLEKCVITAPVSGTVTAVNAVEGGGGSGLLFVIQDTDHLKIITNIKEYDIEGVNVGDRVVITADATGDKEFLGKLSKIAPTSTLTATGTATASTEAVFESEVSVDAGSSGLMIGMNTRLSIITEEKESVFSVPYEALGADPDGGSYIYAVTTGEKGEAVYEKIPVQTGLESNLYVEISGEALQEGMQVARSILSVPAEGETGGGPGGSRGGPFGG